MAGSIELIPKIPVILAQGAVFGASIYVVNKLIVKPYSLLREKREELTSGSEEQAKAMQVELSTKLEAIRTSKEKAFSDASDFRKSRRIEAINEAEKIISEAKDKASMKIGNLKVEIAENLSQELAKAPKTAEVLSDELYKAALS